MSGHQGEKQKRGSKRRQKLDLTGSVGEVEALAEGEKLNSTDMDTSSYNASNIQMKSVFNQKDSNLQKQTSNQHNLTTQNVTAPTGGVFPMLNEQASDYSSLAGAPWHA